MKTTGSSDRIAALSSPLASAGVDGMTTVRPGDVREQRLEALRVLAARAAPGAELVRTVSATRGAAGHERHLRGLVEELVEASADEVEVHDLDDRPQPGIAAPTPRPTIALSEIGVSRTRASPNRSCSPRVTPNDAARRPTSSPSTTTARRARSSSASASCQRPAQNVELASSRPAPRVRRRRTRSRSRARGSDGLRRRPRRLDRAPRSRPPTRRAGIVARRPSSREPRARAAASGSRASHSATSSGRAVALRVALVVAVPAVGRRLDQRRAARRRAPRATTAARGVAHGDDVVAVDRDSPDAVAGARERASVAHRACVGRGRELGVAVVLAEEDRPAAATPRRGSPLRGTRPARPRRRRRTPPRRCRRRAAAPRSPRRPRSGGRAPTIAVGAEDADARVGDVHRAAAARCVPVARPISSANIRAGSSALGEAVAVAAVGRRDHVAASSGRNARPRTPPGRSRGAACPRAGSRPGACARPARTRGSAPSCGSGRAARRAVSAHAAPRRTPCPRRGRRRPRRSR